MSTPGGTFLNTEVYGKILVENRKIRLTFSGKFRRPQTERTKGRCLPFCEMCRITMALGEEAAFPIAGGIEEGS